MVAAPLTLPSSQRGEKKSNLNRWIVPLVTLALALAGCAAPTTPAPSGGGPAAPAQPRTLRIVVNTEVSNLAIKAIGPTNPERTTRLFNANLTLIDSQGTARPYLAESLPQLNTDSWRVLPDGRMEVTWKLRPGLTWHDGQPLTADDFVFSFHVYTTQGLGGFEPKPANRIERIVAVDPRTVQAEWRVPYLDNGQGLDPLPNHLLADTFATVQRDPAAQREPFFALRFWTMEYVGAGPYRLTGWEPASHLDAAAFDGHVLGRPKIDRIVLRFINDENAVLAALLAGDVDFSINQAIRFDQAMILKREAGFDSEGKGKLLFLPTSTNTAVPQHRADYQKTPALHDLRVRKAFAYTIDKEGLNDALFEGQAPVADSFVQPYASYLGDVTRGITLYRYDPRKSEELMAEAGYTRGRVGLFVGPTGDRIQPPVWNSAGAEKERALTLMANVWQRAGFDVQPFVMPNALERDQQARNTYPGILIHGISLSEGGSAQSLTAEQIGTPANGWNGNNRGGWSNPDYETLWERYNSTLARAEQIQIFVQMMKLQNDQLPNLPLYPGLNVSSHAASLKGPDTGISETTQHWNIQDWEIIS